MKTIFIIIAILVAIIFLTFTFEVKAGLEGHKRLTREANEHKYKPYMDEGYKYVAKDADGSLFAYKVKPFKVEEVWVCKPMTLTTMKEIKEDKVWFESVKWSDRKPKSFEELMEEVWF